MTPDRILTRDEAFSPIVPPLTIELTSRCNLKCPYCANPSLKRSYGEMPLDLIFRLAEECAASSHRVMAVHGIGEPLLRKDLEVILARFRDLGIWQGWISTNGAILSVRRMGTLVEAGLKGLYVSIDTLDADMYRRTRGGRLAKTIENIRQCAAAHPNIPFVIGLMSHREQVIDSTTLDLF
ncbi:MAG: radical SAM protein, partial [Hyphomicrobiaceae bacterium]